jgi:pimeloyl-ACP methyl ester carboxylesterase
MSSPTTKYAKSGDVHIAYQVIGDGASDLLIIPGAWSHLDVIWEEPSCARFLRRLASFSRVIIIDKRGSGLSDRVTDMPTLEQRMDDVRAVMDATGSQRAALLGISEGGAMSILFAGTYPERTAALILYGTGPRCLCTKGYPWG